MSFMKKAGVTILFPIAIILIVILALSLTLSSFLYPPVYFQAFESAGVYSYIEQNIGNAESATFIDFQDGVKPTIERLFSNFLEYMRSDSDVLNLTVKIDKEKLRSFFLDAVTNVSECRQGQDPFNKENPCLPRGMSSEQFLDYFLESNNLTFLDKDEVDLAQVYGIEQGSEGRESLDNARNYIKYYRLSSIIIAIVILTIWFLIFLLQRPNTRKVMRTISLTLIASSLILFLAVKSITSLQDKINIQDPLLISLAQTVIGLVSSKLTIFTAISGIAGIILLILSLIVKNPMQSANNKEKKQVKKA